MIASNTVIVISVSGGKDSTAIADIGLERFGPDRCELVFADTGNEHAITLDHIHGYLSHRWNVGIKTVKADFADRIAGKRRYVREKWPEKGVSQSVIDRALAVLEPTGIPFLDLCLWKGRFPSRKAQFCTQELKGHPLNAFMFDLMAAGRDLESWQGIRRDESQNRSDALKVESAAEGWLIRRPIVHWTADMVVRYVRRRGIKLNPLYTMGMGRVGCMPCINCNKAELAEIARRFPDHIDKIREWESLMCQAAKRGWTTFFGDKAKDIETDAEIFARLNIDARVDWAKTSRGGKQYDLLKIVPPPICSSMYGLCE